MRRSAGCSACCDEDHKWEKRVLVPEYTVITVFAVVAVVAAELLYFKSGILTTAQYWWTMLIIFAFQIPVDGWLTKLSAPIVIYNADAILGLHAPWDLPI